MNTTTRDEFVRLENFVDDQAELIRQLAKGMRYCFQELNKDIPDINRAMDLLDEHYVGGRGNIRKASNGGIGRRNK